jgi:hypothetical protein
VKEMTEYIKVELFEAELNELIKQKKFIELECTEFNTEFDLITNSIDCVIQELANSSNDIRVKLKVIQDDFE